MFKKKFKRFVSILALVAMVLTMVPGAAFAQDSNAETGGETIDLATFVKDVENASYDYDGKGVTVEIELESGCWLNHPEQAHPEATEKTPNRLQSYDGIYYAQYQRFDVDKDINISNVHFKLVEPTEDIQVCGPWNESQTTASKDKLDAELQFLTTGNLSFSGCTFDNVAISPIESVEDIMFENCRFSGLGGYAIKDVKAKNVIVSNSTFSNCSGGIYLNNGGTEQTTCNNNSFNTIGTRGAIQFSKEGDYSCASIVIEQNKFISSPDTKSGFLRCLNETVPKEVLISLGDNNAIEGNMFTSDSISITIMIGENAYSNLVEALEAVQTMQGDVTIDIYGAVNINGLLGENQQIDETKIPDLSESSVNRLTIRGANEAAAIVSGVDGNNIDGEKYCPRLNIKLPENAKGLVVENLTIPNDLCFDASNSELIVQNCVFNGAMSAYPEAKEITYRNNLFEFKGTMDNFYTHNAYPVWYKINGSSVEKNIVFDGNTVIGPRGFHVEYRGDQEFEPLNVSVTNNHFTLKDDDYKNKTIALWLVNQLNGNVSFISNQVDGYMGVCFFKDLGWNENSFLTISNNEMSETAKLYGSSEWNADSVEAADEFAKNFVNAIPEENKVVNVGHTEHHYVNGVCTICGAVESYEPPYTGKYSYEIIVKDVENGTLTVDKYATEDETVTVTAIPNDGYQLESLQASAGNEKVAMNDQGNGIYSFVMPSHDVVLTATFVEAQPVSLPFTDVVEDDWYYEAVQYVYANGLMNGVDDTLFAPNNNLSRAMMAAVLYNIEGGGAVSESVFNDVSDGAWYADAVNWAAANDIVGGYEDGSFRPNAPITREQMASIFYRYAAYKGYDTNARADLGTYTDSDDVSVWAKEVMQWAVGAELIHGMSDNILLPQGNVTRAQAATVLMNYCGSIEK